MLQIQKQAEPSEGAVVENNRATNGRPRPIRLERTVVRLFFVVWILLAAATLHMFPIRSLISMAVGFSIITGSFAEAILVPILLVRYRRFGMNFDKHSRLVVLAGCAGAIPFVVYAWIMATTW